MIHKPSNFKVVWIVAIIVLFGIYTGNLSAQNSKFNYTYKVDSVLSEGKYVYNVTINITEGTGSFIYELFDKTPTYGGKSLECSTVTQARQYTFSKLTEKEYYIYVYSENREFGRGMRIYTKTAKK